jgi:hypothetical protein
MRTIFYGKFIEFPPTHIPSHSIKRFSELPPHLIAKQYIHTNLKGGGKGYNMGVRG